MFSAIGAFNSMFSAMNRIDAGNRLLSNANEMNQNVASVSRQAMTFGSAGIPMQSLAFARQKEKALMASNLQNSLLYKIASAQEDAQKAKEKKRLDYKA
jgi:hypothetical protein